MVRKLQKEAATVLGASCRAPPPLLVFVQVDTSQLAPPPPKSPRNQSSAQVPLPVQPRVEAGSPAAPAGRRAGWMSPPAASYPCRASRHGPPGRALFPLRVRDARGFGFRSEALSPLQSFEN